MSLVTTRSSCGKVGEEDGVGGFEVARLAQRVGGVGAVAEKGEDVAEIAPRLCVGGLEGDGAIGPMTARLSALYSKRTATGGTKVVD